MKAQTKSSFIWIGVVVAIIAFVVFLVRTGTPSNSGASISGEITDTDNKKGAENPKVTLIEYSDFQCPACSAFYPMAKQLVEEFPEDVQFIYRHFPLDQHLQARGAAYAAEAAGKQGQFWGMHDMLFNTQSTWSDNEEAKTIFESYANSLGLDMEQFRTDRDSKEVSEKVTSDLSSGNRSGVRGTPTFYINGEQITNPRSYDAFKQLIQSAING